MKAASNKVTVDPDLFTNVQWNEAYYTDGDNVLKLEYEKAKPVKATRAKVRDLAGYCRSKAKSVLDGELGESDSGWADDLIGAAEILEKLAGVESPKRPREIREDLARAVLAGDLTQAEPLARAVLGVKHAL